ncbi:MAG: metallophosphoesterase family protein [Verrucomicrobiae bacterium]|nr:metallophosphoesterase family protein [Verrucomicrobiae bacterium]
MRTLAIGDIHGCLKALTSLIGFVGPTAQDRLVFLGDYIDRGPDSKGVIDWLIDEKRRRGKKLITLRGNHEVMLLGSRTTPNLFMNWRSFGGLEMLESYGVNNTHDWVEHIPREHWDFFEATLPYFESNSHIFVHGGIEPDVEMQNQPDMVLYWQRFENFGPHDSGKTVVCGHTSQKSGEIAQRPGSLCVDTWPLGQWLTCLDVDSGRFWQANQKGDTRKGLLKKTV